MLKHSRLFTIFLALFLSFSLLIAILSLAGGAYAKQIESDELPLAASAKTGAALQEGPASTVALTPTTLSLINVSARNVPVDSNKPNTGPHVYVVHAVVTNTGTTTAEQVVVSLDYDENPSTGWILLPGENPERVVDSLAPGEAYHGYWFASYPLTIDATHKYTLTAMADNAPQVATSDNYYGNPVVGQTVKTERHLSTANTGLTQVAADVVIGVAYTITVGYEIGTNPAEISFSPVGNFDFDPSSTRLLGSIVTFSGISGTVPIQRDNQLYFPIVPTLSGGEDPTFAEVEYILLPLTTNNTSICTYTSVYFSPNYKYDNGYCTGTQIIPIEGELSFQLTKSVDRLEILQGEELNYTIHYTNDGTLPLQSVWIWDEVDPGVASIVTNTMDPAPDPGETTDYLVAWYLGDVPELGQPGSSGTLTVTVVVDGDGSDLSDGQPVINTASFGINPGSLPSIAALTQTTTSNVQAPELAITKSDGLDEVGNGETAVYTININNSGSVTATNLNLSDVLPSGVVVTGTVSPPYADYSGGVVTWGPTELGDLSPGEGLTVTLPGEIGTDIPSFTVLTNTAAITYDNEAAYTFDTESVVDTTSVARRAGHIEGYAFVDANGDGVFNIGESGIPDVDVSLPEAVDPLVTTDSTGYYNFRVEIEGSVEVTAGLPATYFRTTPGSVFLINSFNITQTANFGYALTSSGFGSVYGTVFDDTNQNGQRESGEGPLVGVRIDSADAVTPTLFTNDLGQYTFKYLAPVSTVVSETNPSGYVSTTPDEIPVNVVTGSDNGSPYDFGDFAGIVITGQVFDDVNFNGVNDGESGLAGATVSAGGDNMVTLADGQYQLFAVLTGGPITVTEQDPGSYVSTGAVPGAGVSLVDANTLRIDSPVAGQTYSGDFGDVAANDSVVITGTVWDDNGYDGGIPANGIQDGNEPGLPGALVSLSSGANQMTGSDGSFELVGPPNIVITVTETNPADYVSTGAIAGDGATVFDHDTLVLAPQSGGFASEGNQFGDISSSSVVTVSGQVWDDNGAGGGTIHDGVKDPGEPGLAGALVSLSSGMSTTTGQDGLFTLYAPPGQVITLTEVNPANYISSGAIAGNSASVFDADTIQIEALAAEQTSSGNLFGDSLPADLSITKVDSPDPVLAGNLLTYTITLTNHGPNDATGIVVTETLPSGVTLVDHTASSGSFDGTFWTISDLSANITATLDIVVEIGSDVLGTMTNTVEVIAEQYDPVLSNNSAAEVTSVTREVDLSILKSDQPNTVIAGEILTYTLVADNLGPSNASSVVVSDTLPSSLELLNSSASQGAYDGQNWTIGDLTINQQVTLTVVTRVKPEVTGSILNSAEIQGGEFDPQDGNNQASTTTTVAAVADVALSKSVSSPSVTAGLAMTYTLVVANLGPSVAADVQVDDGLPDSVTYQSDQTSQGSYDDVSGTWDVGSLQVGTMATMTLVVVVNPNAMNSIENTAVASASTDDPEPENNSDSATTSVVTEADLSVTKSDDPDPVASGGVLTYTLNYANNGPSDALTVTLTDTLDANVVFGDVISTDPALPSYDLADQVLTWDLGTLEAGTSGTIVFYVTVQPGTIGAVVNEASVSSSITVDPNLSNNSDSEDTSVGSPDLATIFGYVFEDANGNGEWDDGESPISGVTVTLDGSETTQTDGDGLYYFITDQAGVRAVVETDPSNYFSTTPNQIQVNVILGSNYRIDFGDAPNDAGFAAIFGTLFDDENSDGTWDSDEIGIGGVTLTLDGGKTTNSDIYGSYTFSTTSAGTHTVVETDLPYYFSTTPNTVEIDVLLNEGYEVNFGDVLANNATCLPDSYEEDDDYTSASVILLGERQSHDFCDDAVDWVKVTVEVGRVYTFTTWSTGQRADTFISLYGNDGSTLLAGNDDAQNSTDFSSELRWWSTVDGEVYLETTNRTDLTGYETDYEIQVDVESLHRVYLPVIVSAPQASTGSANKLAKPRFFSLNSGAAFPWNAVGPLGVINHSCPDSYEVDDTWTLAGDIVSGVAQSHSFDSDPVLYAADKDFVTFKILPSQTVTFTISSSTSTSALLEVYDETGRAINKSGVDFLYVDDLEPGTYYLSASPTSQIFGCSEVSGYELSADFKPIFVSYLPFVFQAAFPD